MLKKVRPQTYIFLGTALLLYFLLAYLFQAPLLNNGDYHRITKQLVQIPAYLSIDQVCFPIHSDAFFIPSSLANLVFEINVALVAIVSQTCWSLQSYFLMLAAMYCFGLYRCFLCKLSPSTLLGLFLAPLFFSPFLNSLYEEGLVLTLLPWVVLSIDRLRNKGKVLGFTIASSFLILTKTQVVLLVPAMLYAILVYGRATKLSTLKIITVCAILVLAVTGSFYQKQNQKDGQANAYNRLFNGLGWSMQAVHTWPANQFSERLKYFSSYQTKLQEITKHDELVPNLNLWGTSFWPNGLELLTSKNDTRWQNIEEQLQLKSLVKFLYQHPHALTQYLQNGVLVFISSNYAFGVLQKAGPSKISAVLEAINYYSLQGAIWIYVLLLLYLCIMRKGFGRILGVIILMVTPFAVLIGDGFFEFEKHLMPYFLTLPLLLLFIPPKRRL